MRFLRVYIYSKSLINVFETVQQSAKDKEDICRRADVCRGYLTQDFTPDGLD